MPAVADAAKREAAWDSKVPRTRRLESLRYDLHGGPTAKKPCKYLIQRAKLALYRALHVLYKTAKVQELAIT
jgi:hypothetical protein